MVAGARALEAHVSNSNKTVLLVDDSASIRDIVKIYLMGLPFEFLEAESAERGISMLGVVPVDLVIADVKLPGMNGIDFVRRVRKHDLPHVRKVPLVLLTDFVLPVALPLLLIFGLLKLSAWLVTKD